MIGRQLSGRSWKEIPESARATVEWAMGEHLAADFATRRAEIMKGLAKAGKVDSLYDFAGVKLAREFGRLSMKAQGDAYADYVMEGGAEIPATNQEPIKNESRANADAGAGTADLIGARDIEIPAKAMRLLSDAEERDIVTVKSVGQSFENRLGIFNGGLHVPSEADIASQMKALSAARMGAEVEARAIGKYEAATARLIDQAIQHSAVGRTLSNVGTRKAAQAPAGAVTAGVQYRKAGIEFSNSAAAKLKEARDSAAFLEALRRRDSSRSSKRSVKSVADRLGLASPFAVQDPVPDSPAVGNAPNPLEALFSGLDSSSVRKANKAKKAAKLHPLADKIQNVQDNFLDILQELEDSGKVKINC